MLRTVLLAAAVASVAAQECTCPEWWVGDGACDDSCNNPECYFDGGDCKPPCADGCPNNWINDNYCDQTCNNPDCDFDGDDCFGVTPDCSFGCNMDQIGDGYCDMECLNPACMNDGGDCLALMNEKREDPCTKLVVTKRVCMDTPTCEWTQTGPTADNGECHMFEVFHRGNERDDKHKGRPIHDAATNSERRQLLQWGMHYRWEDMWCNEAFSRSDCKSLGRKKDYVAHESNRHDGCHWDGHCKVGNPKHPEHADVGGGGGDDDDGGDGGDDSYSSYGSYSSGSYSSGSYSSGSY